MTSPRRPAAFLLATATAGLLALTLASCSGPSQEEKDAYCAKLTPGSDVMKALQQDPDAQDDGTIAKLREVQDVAPSSVKGDWGTFIDYMQAIADRNEKAINDNVSKAASAATKIQQSIEKYCPTPTP